ncbi:MAG: carboxymuconolactone decarboxylase family protein [Chromatiales bacterium]|jgi:alkylhydroperoxidase family enzyme
MTKVIIDKISPSGGWRTTSTPRLPPIERRNAGLISRAILFAVKKFAKVDIANLWFLLKINPRLLHGMVFFASKFMPFGDLKRIDTELVILRVAWNCRARYQWGQHVQLGMRAGLSVDDILRISAGPESDMWSCKQKALLIACDEFHCNRFLSDSTWNALSSYYNQKLLLELLFVIGFYEGLAGVLNSAGLPLDVAMDAKLSSLADAE